MRGEQLRDKDKERSCRAESEQTEADECGGMKLLRRESGCRISGQLPACLRVTCTLPAISKFARLNFINSRSPTET